MLIMDRITRGLRDIYKKLDRWSGGALGILERTLRSFGEARAGEAAASMAYYAMFSLFPLLLGLIAAGSFLLQRDVVMERVIGAITQVVPVSQTLIEQNVQRLLEMRGTIGLIGLVSLVWSGSGVFSSLVLNVNRAWPQAETQGVVRQRLIALSMVIGLLILLALSSVFATVINLLTRYDLPFASQIELRSTFLWSLFSRGMPRLITFLILFGIYQWVPKAHVPWSAAFSGALVGVVGWNALTAGFAWYVRSGLASYQLIYGSIAAIVVLMFWIYLSGVILLFGAHLSAAVAHHPAETP
jgi:membrane protein